MPRTYDLLLKDILRATGDIQEFIAGMTLEQFRVDKLRLAAVLHNLTIIGEAVKGIPEATREKLLASQWKRIAGLRDFIVHVYFGVNVEIIWNIVQENVPELRAIVQEALAEEEGDSEN